MEKPYIADEVDVIVIGGGHAGCEAALASARMGLNTIMFAINLDSIAMMPCNPVSYTHLDVYKRQDYLPIEEQRKVFAK